MNDPETPILIVTGGSRDGTTLVLDSPSLDRMLGTGPDCHLRVEGKNVDHHHARVLWDERGVVLFDEASTAGTYVNGERVTGERVLADGDRICLGPPGSPASVKLLTRVPALLPLPPLVVKTEDQPFSLESEELAPIVLVDEAEPEPAVLVHEEPPPAEQQEEEVFEAAPEPPAIVPPRPPEPTPVKSASGKRTADYQEVPSIVTERPREAVRPPHTTQRVKPVKAPARKPAPPRVPRLVVIAGATLLLMGGAAFALLQLRQPPPVLNSVTPPKVEPGQTLMLLGTGFDSSAKDNVVRFGDRPGKIVSTSETQITVEAPDGLPGETVAISVETGGHKSNALMAKVGRRPRAVSLEPDVALPGQEITLRGQNLGTGKGLNVTVGGRPVEVQNPTPTALRFRVPDLPVVEGRTVPVAVQVGAEAAHPLNLMLGKLPLIAELAPDNGPAGARVLLRGRGFDANREGNAVFFGSDPALVLSSSESELTVVAPSPSSSENQLRLPVTVRAKGGASSGVLLFTLMRPSMGMYVPRFHAAMVPGEPTLAFVGTELGPALLLGAPDDAPTVGERAVRVAAALNAAIDAARNTPPVFEARGAAIGVQGKQDALVRVLPDDAAAYSRPVDPVMKGQRVAPPQLASFWAALLQDYNTLFIQRQRPTRVVELSPRGKVLLDLFAEAERRSGAGAGVPASLINPMPYALGRALREMALEAPTRGQATAGAAVTGKWQGTFEEKGAPERPVQLRLTLEGTKLTGVISTTSGKVSMELPVQDATYDHGSLVFTVSTGAVPRRFRGTVAGSSVTGTIHAATDNAVIGRFNLKYAE
ncbi:MAG TPA: IPT/TIG domain-containing protein [Vicinamibacteria bacterium]